MNNFCRNCGEKLTNSSVCEKCGTKVLTDRVGELDKLLAKKYITIFFIMFFLYLLRVSIIEAEPKIDNILYSLIESLTSFLPLFLILFVIYAKKKLKYSIFFNIVFWLMLILFILFIIFIIFLLISCEYKF